MQIHPRKDIDRSGAIDLLRTAALCGMVVYHTAFDLRAFYGWNIAPLEGSWWLLAKITAWLFLIVSGISATVAFRRSDNDAKKLWKKIARRVTRIGGGAIAVSVATYLFMPETYVRFGILHLIAVASLILPWTMRWKRGSFFAGMLCIILGRALRSVTAETGLLLPIGVPYSGFQTLDYFPLFPWMGPLFIGQSIGHGWPWVEKRCGDFWVHPFIQRCSLPGRYSLMIYLLHQPLIMAILFMIFGKPNI